MTSALSHLTDYALPLSAAATTGFKKVEVDVAKDTDELDEEDE